MMIMGFLNWLALLLFGLFALDRGLKHLAVTIFFRRPAPAPLAAWPALALIQPLTRSHNDLPAVLRSRAQLAYLGPCQQVLVYDAKEAAGALRGLGLGRRGLGQAKQ